MIYILHIYLFISFGIREKSGLHFLIVQSCWRLVRYHLGTVAFGSFLVALIQFIRMIMKYVEKKLQQNGTANRAFIICLKVSLNQRISLNVVFHSKNYILDTTILDVYDTPFLLIH